jgi:curved DNA-binding protein CbpA
MSTLYHDLGLQTGASHEQVKAAFRALARRFHPDVNNGNAVAEQRFKEVSRAYETLADPDARQAYDRALVCRADEVRQQRWTFAVTAGASFALTIGCIGLALWWMRAAPEPERARAPEQAWRVQVAGAHEPTQAGDEVKGETVALPVTALPEVRARGSGWIAYHNAPFKFSLKYPADVFAYDVGVAHENVRTFVSRDGTAVLNIFTTDNVANASLARYRRARMEEHYADAVFEKSPQRKYWFVLSGTQRERAFYERVTFSCDGRSIHGWQMIFPVSQRTVYDLVADEVDRTYRQRTRPGARCG